MPKLFAVTMLVIAGMAASAAQVQHASGAPTDRQLTLSSTAGRPLDPQKKAWFDKTVAKILGDPSGALTPTPSSAQP